MNREQAHQIISSLLCGTHKESSSNHYRDVALGIDKIYDEFEKEKEIIARGILNKTCENCRNYINYHKVCREDVTFYKQKQLPKTFGCNKWVQNVI